MQIQNNRPVFAREDFAEFTQTTQDAMTAAGAVTNISGLDWLNGMVGDGLGKAETTYDAAVQASLKPLGEEFMKASPTLRASLKAQLDAEVGGS